VNCSEAGLRSGLPRDAAARLRVGRHDGGQALLWFALMLPFLLGIVGLVTDAGSAYVQRQALQTVADDAARTGAERLDPQRYYAGDQAVLDPQAARQAALTYLVDVAPGTAVDVEADQQRVVVTVQRAVPLPFLAAIGLRTATVRAEGVATVVRQGR
jgi:Flp pilus assembly protein TadG